MALTLMGGGIVCRPSNVNLGEFAMGTGGASPGGYFAYGMAMAGRPPSKLNVGAFYWQRPPVEE